MRSVIFLNRKWVNNIVTIFIKQRNYNSKPECIQLQFGNDYVYDILQWNSDAGKGKIQKN